MVLESVENQTDLLSSMKPVKVNKKERVISESTGLVKFNLTNSSGPSRVEQKVKEVTKLNNEFQSLEEKLNRSNGLNPQSQLTGSPQRTLRTTKSGLNLGSSMYSPNRASLLSSVDQSSPVRRRPEPSANKTIGTVLDNEKGTEELFINLAAKQRQVFDYSTQIEELKQKSKQAERELHELEKRCNNLRPSSTTGIRTNECFESSSNTNNFVKTLRTKASITQIRSQIESSTSIHQQNFITLKKKLSMAQISTSTEAFNSLQSNNTKNTINLNENFNKFQKDTKILFSKSLQYVNNLSKELQEKIKDENYRKYDDYNGDTSDEEVEEHGMQKRRTLRTRKSTAQLHDGRVELFTTRELDDDIRDVAETSTDWSIGEADASDYMLTVK